MTTTYQTIVLHVPPSPLGLLPARDFLEHWCRTCRQQVETAELIAHAHSHRNADRQDLPFDAPMVHNGRHPDGGAADRITQVENKHESSDETTRQRR